MFSWICFRSPPGNETERAVASDLVIEAEVVVDACAGLVSGGVGFTINAFEFKGTPDRFHGGVVVTIGPATHAGDGTDFSDGSSVGFARVLAASVGVDDQAGRGTAVVDRHGEGVEGQGGVDFIAHGQADLASAGGVFKCTQVEPAFAGLHVGDAAASDFVGLIGCWSVAQHVVRD